MKSDRHWSQQPHAYRAIIDMYSIRGTHMMERERSALVASSCTCSAGNPSNLAPTSAVHACCRFFSLPESDLPFFFVWLLRRSRDDW